LDRETLKRIVAEKMKKKTEANEKTKIENNGNNNILTQGNSVLQKEDKYSNSNSATPENTTPTPRITETNSNISSVGDKNSPEVNREHKEKVSKVSLNLGSYTSEKFSDTFSQRESNKERKQSTSLKLDGDTSEKFENYTFDTFSFSTIQSSGEFSSSEEKETEDEDIEIKDKMIIIRGKNKTRFEIYYGFAGTVEDSTRIKDLKIPQLPQWNFTAKKKNEVLSLLVTVDFYEVEGRTIYYIRNRKEVVEKLYMFRHEKHISKRLISDALDVWLDRINPEKYIQWVDVREVVKKYKEWDEINQDPLNFFLDRASDVIGNEKLKVAVLLSVVSSQLAKIRRGIYRVHLILTGSSGVGKSSTIKSILDLFYDNADGVEDFVVLKLTRMTKEALGRLNVDTLDGKVIFIEQLDNVEGVDYIREAMSEDRITTLTTVKDEEGNLVSRAVVIPGQPAFITTNVTANIDHQILNRSIQLYLSPTEDEKLKSKIIETILERGEISADELGKLKLIIYVWLKTRPSSPKMTKEVKDELVKLLSKFINFKNIYRATEITRNLVRASASLFGHEEITMDDVDFIMKYFKKDIILTTLELSERDLQLLRWLRDHGFVEGEKEEETKSVATSEVAQVVKMSSQETKKLLDTLYDKGLLWKSYDGKRFSWAINHYGMRVLEELEREVEEQKGEEADVVIEDQLLAYISSKLIGKENVTEEELRGILEKTAQATDIGVQDILIEALERKGVIKSNGDGTWRVL